MSSSLRIAMVTNNYTPYAGGVVNSIHAHVQQLQELGHDVLIITLDFLGKEHNDPPYVKRVPCPIKFQYKNNHMAIPWRAHHHVKKLLLEYKPAIIHSHHPALLGDSACKVARKLKIPIVFTYHTLYEAYTHYVPLPERLTRPVIKKVVQEYCCAVDGIIAPSEPIKQMLAHQNIGTQTTVIPSGIHPLFIMPEFEPKRGNAQFSLLCVSRCMPEKNLPLLFDLVKELQKQLENFTFTLIGYGADYELLKRYAYQILGLSPQLVRFIHKPDKQTIARYYRASDLFLFSSQTDTQALVLAEAMASGTPVVALYGPGQESIIQQAENGFLVSSAQEMVDAIMKIAHNPDLHLQLQRGAWQTAQNYAPQVRTQELIGFYGRFL